MRGKEGLRWWFGLAVGSVSAGKAPDPCQILLEPGNFSTVFMARERRFPVRLAKVFFGSGFFRSPSFLPVSCRRGRGYGRRRGKLRRVARSNFARSTLALCRSWCLSGPVGANGRLLISTGRHQSCAMGCQDRWGLDLRLRSSRGNSSKPARLELRFQGRVNRPSSLRLDPTEIVFLPCNRPCNRCC